MPRGGMQSPGSSTPMKGNGADHKHRHLLDLACWLTISREDMFQRLTGAGKYIRGANNYAWPLTTQPRQEAQRHWQRRACSVGGGLPWTSG